MKKKQSLYNSSLGKIKWFVVRFGISQLFMKPLRMVFAPFIIFSLKPQTFTFGNTEYNYFYHAYNTTWANERCVEIPIIKKIMEKYTEDILEVGNVISHYYPVNWDILDKFEKGKRVINEDITTFAPLKKYALIVSISTLEHVGYDDDSFEKSSDKIMKAFDNLRNNCLDNTGKMIITVPIGYNPEMDKLLSANQFKFNEQKFLKRISRKKWKEVSKEEAMQCNYGKPFSYANAVMIGFYKKK